MLNNYLPNGSVTESSPPPQSLTTSISSYSPVQLQNTEDLSMWLQQNSPANCELPPNIKAASTAPEISGQPQSNAYASYNRTTASWQLPQGLLFPHISPKSSAILYKAGMTVNGVSYRQQKWERTIRVKDFGLWPTLGTKDHLGQDNLTLFLRKRNPHAPPGGRPNPDWTDWYMGLPISWTALEPLPTHKFQQWLDVHGSPSTRNAPCGMTSLVTP